MSSYNRISFSRVIQGVALFILVFVTTPALAATEELIVNGGFEDGTSGWTLAGAAVVSGGNQHAGTRYAVLGELNSGTDLLSQVMTVPDGAGLATASFYYYIYTEETAGGEYDTLEVDLVNLTTNTTYPIARLSNLDGDTCTSGSSCYEYLSKDLDLTGMDGDSIQIRFRSTMDADTFTSFKIDDVSLLVHITDEPTGSAPTAVTDSATNLSSSGATLNGTVNPNGLTTEVNFLWREPDQDANPTNLYQDIGDGTSPVSVSTAISGLEPNTQYEFQVYAVNAINGSFGDWNTFTTSGATQPACSDGIDNDGDGLVDYPDDPDCTDPNDTSEQGSFGGGVLDIAVSDGPDPFTPSNGETNTITVQNVGSEDCDLTLTIEDTDREWIHTDFVHGTTMDFPWDGRNSGGDLVSAGDYTYRAECEQARNSTAQTWWSQIFTWVTPIAHAFFSDTETGTITVLDGGVTPPPPSIPVCDVFVANPAIVAAGGSTTLTWESSDAESAHIDNGIGPVPVNGSIVVQPQETTTYTATFGGVEDKTCSVDVTVESPDPVPECADGIDNDEDGFTDTNDPGCYTDLDIENGTFMPEGVEHVDLVTDVVREIDRTKQLFSEYFGESYLDRVGDGFDARRHFQSVAVKEIASLVFTIASKALDLSASDDLYLKLKAGTEGDVLLFKSALEFYGDSIQRAFDMIVVDNASDSVAHLLQFLDIPNERLAIITDRADETQQTYLSHVLSTYEALPQFQLTQARAESIIERVKAQRTAYLSYQTYSDLRIDSTSAMADMSEIDRKSATLFWAENIYNVSSIILEKAYPASWFLFTANESIAGAQRLSSSVKSYSQIQSVLNGSGAYADTSVFPEDTLGAMSRTITDNFSLITSGREVTDIRGTLTDVFVDGDFYGVRVHNPTDQAIEYQLIVTGDFEFESYSFDALGIAERTYNIPSAYQVGGTESDWLTVEPESNRDFIVELPAEFLNNQLFLLGRKDDTIVGLDTESVVLERTGYFFNRTLVVKLNSPGDLHIKDGVGRVTGFVNGEVREEIPHSIYSETDHAVVVFQADDSYEYNVVGNDTGTYGLFAGLFTEEDETQIGISNVPTRLDMRHSYEVAWSTTTDGTVLPAVRFAIDADNDGENEHILSIADDYSDTIAPTTTVTWSGNVVAEDIYTTPVTLSLIARDNEGGVGVERTEYSFDAEHWHEYSGTTTVSEEGEHTIYYRSTDWFGNVEDTKRVTFEIVSARGLIEETHVWAEAGGSKQLERMLATVLEEKLWEDRNTVRQAGGKSVESRVRNAIRFIGTSNPYYRERLELAQSILHPTE